MRDVKRRNCVYSVYYDSGFLLLLLNVVLLLTVCNMSCYLICYKVLHILDYESGIRILLLSLLIIGWLVGWFCCCIFLFVFVGVILFVCCCWCYFVRLLLLLLLLFCCCWVFVCFVFCLGVGFLFVVLFLYSCLLAFTYLIQPAWLTKDSMYLIKKNG